MNLLNRTFSVNQLYYKFLKPHGFSTAKSVSFALGLEKSGFIILLENNTRYIELEKMQSKSYKRELYKLVYTC